MNHPEKHPFADSLRRVYRAGIVAAVVGLAAVVVLLIGHPESFFHGYIFAITFWLSFPLGCMTLLMIHHLSAGGWGVVTQRMLEAGMLTIVPLALLFIPVFFGMHSLYEWTHEEVVSGSPILQHKKPYLNVTFFIFRSIGYLLIWVAMAVGLVIWSRRLDRTADHTYVRYRRRLAAGGLVLHVCIVTFAWIDWVMSLEPHWYSSVYGWLVGVGQVLLAIIIIIPTLGVFWKRKPLAGIVRRKHFHDWGNLLLAFVVLWTYMMFVQFLIYWAGNIPEQIEWYTHRYEGWWLRISRIFIVFHFVVPFVLLLLRRVKRSVPTITSLCIGIFVMHIVYVAWLVLPAFHDSGIYMFAAAAAAFVGLGGVTAAVFGFGLMRLPVLPTGDPRFKDILKQTSSKKASS